MLDRRGELLARDHFASIADIAASALVRDRGSRWIVAPYGEVSWVQNARAAGEVKLSRGRRSETVRVRELASAESAPVLKAYIARVAVTRPFFDVNPGSPIDAFVAEAPRHPVFLIEAPEEPAEE